MGIESVGEDVEKSLHQRVTGCLAAKPTSWKRISKWASRRTRWSCQRSRGWLVRPVERASKDRAIADSLASSRWMTVSLRIVGRITEAAALRARLSGHPEVHPQHQASRGTPVPSDFGLAASGGARPALPYGELTIVKTLLGPNPEDSHALESACRDVLASLEIWIVAAPPTFWENAARLRSETRLRFTDALHAAE